MPTAKPPQTQSRVSRLQRDYTRKFGDNVRSRREAQDLSSSSTLSLPAVSLSNRSNGQEQLAERADYLRNRAATDLSRNAPDGVTSNATLDPPLMAYFFRNGAGIVCRATRPEQIPGA